MRDCTKAAQDREDGLDDGHKFWLYPKESKVIVPDSSGKQIFDVFIGILIFYSVLEIPLSIGFALVDTPGRTAINWAIDCFFTIDIITNFLTGFYDTEDEGKLVDDLTKVRNSGFCGRGVSIVESDLKRGME